MWNPVLRVRLGCVLLLKYGASAQKHGLRRKPRQGCVDQSPAGQGKDFSCRSCSSGTWYVMETERTVGAL